MKNQKSTVATIISLLTALCIAIMLCAVIAFADNTPLGTAFAASTSEIIYG